MTDLLPLLTDRQAERVGDALHDHLLLLTGASPFARGDPRLAETARFIIRKALELSGKGKGARS